MSEDIQQQKISVNFTAYYATRKPVSYGGEAPAILLALHGWGQRCTSFMRSIAPIAEQDIFLLAPQAFHQFYLDHATKKVGCSWLTAWQREQSIQDVNAYLATLLEKIRDDNDLKSSPVYIMGFSQGSSMAWRFAVSGLAEVSGLIACGADIPPDVIEAFPSSAPFPVLLAHGKNDELVSEIVLEANQTILREAHLPYELYHYDGGHEITPEFCQKVGEWIDK